MNLHHTYKYISHTHSLFLSHTHTAATHTNTQLSNELAAATSGVRVYVDQVINTYTHTAATRNAIGS